MEKLDIKTKLLALIGIVLGLVSIKVCNDDLTFFVFMSMLCGMTFLSGGSDNESVSKKSY